MIRGAIALSLALFGFTVWNAVLPYEEMARPQGPSGWTCTLSPVLGGTAVPDQFGMYPAPTWGRECMPPKR